MFKKEEPPISCLLSLLEDYPPSVPFSQEQNEQGFAAFNGITQWNTIDYTTILQEMRAQEERQFYINSIFFFTPVVFVISAVLWADNLSGNIDQSSQIFYYTLAFIIIYGASIYYRYRASQVFDSYQKPLIEAAIRDQISFQNSVNRWIQGLEAASCQISIGSTVAFNNL
jgi:hypothetical protein